MTSSQSKDVSLGRSTHQYKNIHDLRSHKQKLLLELKQLHKDEQRTKQFEQFKRTVLDQLLSTYMEFLSYLMRLLDATRSWNQQKFIYWTNLKHFACDSERLDAKVGSDISQEYENYLDKLFGEIQEVIQAISTEEIQQIQHHLNDSILYQMFVRSRKTKDDLIQSILLRSPLRRIDLLLLQKHILLDMRREKSIDPILKRFYDEWLVPHLKNDQQTAIEDDSSNHQLLLALQRLLKRVFQSLLKIQNVHELERVVWLVTRQWNFLFIECDQKLQVSETNAQKLKVSDIK